MPKQTKSRIAENPLNNDFVLTFQGVSCGILGDLAYTVEDFKDKEHLLKWAEHMAFFFNKMGRNMDLFVQYIKVGKVKL